ncbi:hypothetical protein ACLOJK_032535 [Asimina triloba]
MRNLGQVPPASFVLPPPPSGHDARLMDATGRPNARHREATARTDEIVPRSSCLVCSRPMLSRTTSSILVCSSPSPVRLRIRRPPLYLRPPAASSPSSSPFSSSVAVSPCLSLALHNVFYGLSIPDLDCRQRLPRRLLHSRAPSSFPLVSLSLHNVFSGRPILDLDRRQRLPRRLLHSRAPSPFSPVVFSIPGLCQRLPRRLLHSRSFLVFSLLGTERGT